MQIGQLDQRIALLRKTVTGLDTSGADILGTPETLATVSANVAHL